MTPTAPIELVGSRHRMLYFFHGSIAAVVSHGLIKAREVPQTKWLGRFASYGLKRA